MCWTVESLIKHISTQMHESVGLLCSSSLRRFEAVANVVSDCFFSALRRNRHHLPWHGQRHLSGESEWRLRGPRGRKLLASRGGEPHRPPVLHAELLLCLLRSRRRHRYRPARCAVVPPRGATNRRACIGRDTRHMSRETWVSKEANVTARPNPPNVTERAPPARGKGKAAAVCAGVWKTWASIFILFGCWPLYTYVDVFSAMKSLEIESNCHRNIRLRVSQFNR